MPVHPFPAETAQKRFLALRYWLHGMQYHEALRAMEYNRKLFAGTRKDGITPEFDHHVCQAQYVRTLLPHLMHPEATLCTIFFHDTREDKGVSQEEISSFFADRDFGDMVARSTTCVTKKWRGEVYPQDKVFGAITKDPIASIVKGSDRIHNFQTMIDVFSIDKQKAYLKEGETLFLPMLKEAELLFPSQEPAYKNIRTFLKSQMALISAMHRSGDLPKA